jgi:hypothetical protein
VRGPDLFALDQQGRQGVRITRGRHHEFHGAIGEFRQRVLQQRLHRGSIAALGDCGCDSRADFPSLRYEHPMRRLTMLHHVAEVSVIERLVVCQQQLRDMRRI